MDAEFSLTPEMVAFLETPAPVVFGVILLLSGVLGALFNAYLLGVTCGKQLLKNPVMVLMKVSARFVSYVQGY